MAGNRSKCAVAQVLDIVGDRWTLLVIRDLVLGKTSFSAISASAERIPPSTLTARLDGIPVSADTAADRTAGITASYARVATVRCGVCGNHREFR